MRHCRLAALFVALCLLLAGARAHAQTAGWLSPAASSYSAASGDNGKILASDLAPGASLTVTLPSPASVGAGWQMGFSTGGGHAIVLNAPVSSYILAGQKTATSFTLNSANYEYALLQSDGTNFRLLSATAQTALANGIEVPAGAGWTYLFSTGYSATVGDNGAILSSALAGGPVTVTLPSTPLLPNGWRIRIYNGGNAISVQTNGVQGGSIATPAGVLLPSYGLYTKGTVVEVSFDGAAFHILNSPLGSIPASAFGIATDGSDQSANLTAWSQAARLSGLPALFDVCGTAAAPVGYDDVPIYPYMQVQFSPCNYLKKTGSGPGLHTTDAIGSSTPTTQVDKVSIDGPNIDMNGQNGTAILLEGAQHSTLSHFYIYNVAQGTWTWTDGFGDTADYDTTGVMVKGTKNLLGSWGNEIFKGWIMPRDHHGAGSVGMELLSSNVVPTSQFAHFNNIHDVWLYGLNPNNLGGYQGFSIGVNVIGGSDVRFAQVDVSGGVRGILAGNNANQPASRLVFDQIYAEAETTAAIDLENNACTIGEIKFASLANTNDGSHFVPPVLNNSTSCGQSVEYSSQAKTWSIDGYAPPNALSNESGFQFVGKSGRTTAVELNTFGAPGRLAMVRYNGTNGHGTLSALTNGNQLGEFDMWGYDGTSVSVGPQILGYATEDWTATHHGSQIKAFRALNGHAASILWQSDTSGGIQFCADATGCPATADDGGVAAKGNIAAGGTLSQGGVNVLNILSGTSGSIGGALTAGNCASDTITIAGALAGMQVSASPASNPGSGIMPPIAWVSSTNTVTVNVCAAFNATATSVAYNVRVIQ